MESAEILRQSSLQCIATLGPASFHLAGALAAAGATALRLNTSHMSFEQVERTLAGLPDRPSSVILDLQGAKMRLGIFPETPVRSGAVVTFRLAPAAAGEIPLPHPEFFRGTRPGDTLRSDDDRLRFRVLEARGETLHAEALADGILQSRKGINVLDHPVRLDGLGPFDGRICRSTAPMTRIGYALSFVEDGHELDWLRRLAPGRSVTAKIERAEAVDRLGDISAQADTVWICRGDLGAQLGPAAMSSFVSEVRPAALGRPVLMAGQVLEYLTAHAEPTRSEVCHLYDLLARGYAGIVLSDETAVGVDPVRAVRVAAELMIELAGATGGRRQPGIPLG